MILFWEHSDIQYCYKFIDFASIWLLLILRMQLVFSWKKINVEIKYFSNPSSFYSKMKKMCYYVFHCLNSFNWWIGNFVDT